jgi:hypothetical protein
MRVLTKHKVIRELFENWQRTYLDISSAGTGEVSRLIGTPLKKPSDVRKNDLYVPHEDKVKVNPNERRNVSLPEKVFKPKVKISKKKKADTVKVNLTFALDDARRVAALFGIEGQPGPGELGTAIKDDLLKRAGRRRLKK